MLPTFCADLAPRMTIYILIQAYPIDEISHFFKKS
jgi:hypothetical protein